MRRIFKKGLSFVVSASILSTMLVGGALAADPPAPTANLALGPITSASLAQSTQWFDYSVVQTEQISSDGKQVLVEITAQNPWKIDPWGNYDVRIDIGEAFSLDTSTGFDVTGIGNAGDVDTTSDGFVWEVRKKTSGGYTPTYSILTYALNVKSGTAVGTHDIDEDFDVTRGSGKNKWHYGSCDPSPNVILSGQGVVTVIAFLAHTNGSTVPIQADGTVVGSSSEAKQIFTVYSEVPLGSKLDTQDDPVNFKEIYVDSEGKTYDKVIDVQSDVITLADPTDTIYIPYTEDKTIGVGYFEQIGTETAALDVDSTYPKSISGIVGDTVAFNPKDIPGFDTLTGPVSLVLGEDTPDIVVLYARKSVDVSVNYFVDNVPMEGNPFVTPYAFADVLTQKDNPELFENMPTGYKLDKVEGLPLTVSENSGENVINIYYVKDYFPFVVHYYLDGTTTKLIDDTTGTEIFASTLTIDAPDIAGYTVKGDAVKSIVINTTGNEIIFYYTKNIVDEAPPVAPIPDTGTTGSALPIMGVLAGLFAGALLLKRREAEAE
jgi:LPXTG-motif cell wall-anchored protein